jgi:uncharacterized protein YdhG (YjbR/CyaY superfamily)
MLGNMQSQVADVNAYLQEVPESRLAHLERLRDLCLECLPGFEESMRYGMPCYTRPGANEPEVAFANQKQYVSLYILRQDVLQTNAPLLVGTKLGKGCIRYGTPEKMNFDVIRKLLLESAVSQGEIC